MVLIDTNNPVLSSKSIPALKIMGEQGDINAMAYLCWLYLTGNHRIGGREDKGQGIIWARKVVEACQGAAQHHDPHALFNLAEYESDPDIKQGMLLVAHQHFLASAEAGDAEAQFVMALYLMNGLAGYKPDAQEANQWLRKAAEGGHITALHEVWSQENNSHEQLRWILKAVELNHAWAIAELAALHRDGREVKQDCCKAVELMNRAAELGDFGAKFQLSKWYEIGICVEIDIPRAISFLSEVSDWIDDDGRSYLAELKRKHQGKAHGVLTKTEKDQPWWKIW